MSDLVLRGGGRRRMTHAQLRAFQRQMKLANRKLETIQGSIDQHELIEQIQADQLLAQQLEQAIQSD